MDDMKHEKSVARHESFLKKTLHSNIHGQHKHQALHTALLAGKLYTLVQLRSVPGISRDLSQWC